MDNPRPEKVALVAEVRKRFEGADAALLTEYSGIAVGPMQELRRSLREAGGEYKIYKNTLVRLAVRELGLDIEDLLYGPTAIAFVAPGPDGRAGDPVLVAKALKEFAKTDPNLVIKGGLLGDRLLSADEADALADVAPREELLSRFAGGLAAPMQRFASLLSALPTNFAYALRALIDERGGIDAADETSAPAEGVAVEADAGEPVASADESDPIDQTEETETTKETEAPTGADAEAPAAATETTTGES